MLFINGQVIEINHLTKIFKNGRGINDINLDINKGDIFGFSVVLMLDEPLNGLDVEGMIDLRNIIKNLAESEKTTFFISSHLIHDVELTCTRIGVLFNGKMLNVDTTKNILNNYATLENYFVSEVERNGRI